ncbi:CPBP family intramembrane glutamic endopeptidase [Promicromonospora kroppenstedtii]|uniref:CPBP family intramembrane glutamic endopeptidase n=1 Tax=Promicromonospora kroppenstedtii TaxID=440482 RepID=UPI00146F99E6|nr:CPBP family intramembrane glutamic endopeptidase [Promicromonospora kroppenstedtii]
MRRQVADPTNTARWVLPVLVPVAAVLVAHFVLDPGGWAEVTKSLVIGASHAAVVVLGTAVVVLALLAARMLVRGRQGGAVRVPTGRTWTGLAVVAYLVLLTAISGRIAPLPIFAGLERHWQGKVLDLLWLAVLLGILHRWARAEVGLRRRLEPGSARPALILIGVTFGLFAGLTVLSVAMDWLPVEPVSAEQLAYDATIPNLTEELIWRGVMLAVLVAVLPPTRTVLGARVGWAVVISSVAFGVGHTALVDLEGVWTLSLAGGLFATGMGLALGWVWSRTRSVWPAFLLHCAPEIGVDVGMILMA